MSGREWKSLLMGVFAGVTSLGLAAVESAPSPVAAAVPVERSLSDIAVFHAEARLAEAMLAGESADLLDPYLEPSPGFACDDGRARYVDLVVEIAEMLDARNIAYKPKDLADCSGMAHRVLRRLAGRCEGVERPPVRMARRAKDVARWYNKVGRLARVSTAEDIDAALTVGAMAFFLPPGRTRGGLEDVHHIGMIVDIERDEDGRVLGYSMFHGRRPGHPAAITRWHSRDRIPALGNGKEAMIAVAWPTDIVRPDRTVDAMADDWGDDLNDAWGDVWDADEDTAETDDLIGIF